MKKTISRIIGLAILGGIPLGVLYITRKPVQPATVEVEQVSGNPSMLVKIASGLPDPIQKPAQQKPAPTEIQRTSGKTNDLIIVRMRGVKVDVEK